MQQLIESDPYMNDLATAAMRRKQAIADGKGGYSYLGTPSAQYQDIDVEGLKWLGYDPVYGWQKLLCNVEYNDFLKNAQALIEQGRANERDLRAMLSLYPTLHALDQEAKTAGMDYANIPGKNTSGYMGIDDEFLGQMKYDKRTGFDPLIQAIREAAAEKAKAAPLSPIMTGGGETGPARIAWAPEGMYIPGYGVVGKGGLDVEKWEDERYEELLTEFIKENWFDNPGVGGEQLKEWLDQGYTLGQIWTDPDMPYAKLYEGEISEKERKENLARWKQKLTNEEEIAFLDRLHGVEPGEVRPFYAGVHDADLVEVTPEMKQALEDYYKVIDKKRDHADRNIPLYTRLMTQEHVATHALPPEYFDDEAMSATKKLLQTLAEETLKQEQQYIEKYGHALPDVNDVESMAVINPIFNDPALVFIRKFLSSATFGITTELQKAMLPERYAREERISATRPWASTSGELAGFALPMGPLSKGAGKMINWASAKLLGKALQTTSPILFAALEGGASFSVYNGIESVIAGEDAKTVAGRMLEGFGEGAAMGGAIKGGERLIRALRGRRWLSKRLGKEVKFDELPKEEQVETLARELEKVKNDPKVKDFYKQYLAEELEKPGYRAERYVTEEVSDFMRPREADMRGPMPNKSLRPKTSPDTPKVNMDLHSVPNGTVFDLAGRKWVKTTSNMMKTGKPILTTVDGKFQIIQHGDTFKVNRLADSRTGYVNIGEARSLPQAEKMVGDAVEEIRVKPLFAKSETIDTMQFTKKLAKLYNISEEHAGKFIDKHIGNSESKLYKRISSMTDEEIAKFGNALSRLPKETQRYYEEIKSGKHGKIKPATATLALSANDPSIIGQRYNGIAKNNPGIADTSNMSVKDRIEFYKSLITIEYVEKLSKANPGFFKGKDVASIKAEMIKLQERIQKTKRLAKERGYHMEDFPDEPSFEPDWCVENCSEIWAIWDYILQGGKIKDLVIRSIKLKNGEYKKLCENCMQTFADIIRAIE